MSHRPLLSLCAALWSALFPFPFCPQSARAAEIQSPNAPGASQSVRPISQREFADAATTQIGFLAQLRAWRGTLGGNGVRREWKVSPLKAETLAFSLGNVAPQEMGSGAGAAVQWRGLEIGSTARPRAAIDALARFDSLLAGETIAAQTPAPRHWLRARLLASRGAQLELSAARAPGANGRSGADFQSARAKLQLPAQWSLSGDFGRSSVELTDGNEVANAWSLSAAGPVAHPLGVARARANWRETEAGYRAPSAENGAAGTRNGELDIAQELKIGPLSGQLHFDAATRRRAEGEAATSGEELAHSSARSAAQLRLSLSPNLSITGSGGWNSAESERAARGLREAGPSENRELSRQLAGDVGVQWNFSRALSLAASLGASRGSSHFESGEISFSGPQSDEVRRTLEVRRKSGQNDFRLRFSQRERRNSASNTALEPNIMSSAPVSQWRLEAARPLLGSVRFKTILDFAADTAQNQSARRIEAQLHLARAARLDARYHEGNLAPGLLSDEWSSPFPASGSAARAWSARLGAGSAASGAGLGLSLEMVRSQGALPDSYRASVQFK